MDYYQLIFLAFSFLVISAIYSTAGFGGGSSYLALLSLFIQDISIIRTHALLCNVVVVSIGCAIAWKNGKLNLKKAMPFIIFSIPAAFLGSTLKLSEVTFFITLGIALIFTSLVLFYQSSITTPTSPKPHTILLCSQIGGGVGLLSGLVGIGGGIFLSPIMNFFNHEDSKSIARISSCFILFNSISGFSGLMITGTVNISLMSSIALIIPVIIGGYLGTKLSIEKLNNSMLKKATGLLVLMAGIRLLVVYGI